MVERRFILCSSTCSPEEFRRLFPDDKSKPGQSIQKYYRVLCGGFVRNDISINICSKRPVNRKNTHSLFIPRRNESVEGINYHYLGVLNMKGFGVLFSIVAAFFWFIKKKNCSKTDIVIIDPLQLGHSIGCMVACKIRKIKTISYVTDVAKEYAKGGSLPLSFKSLSTRVQINADGMIFVTEQMNNIANPKRRPYVVIEGFVDEQMADYNNDMSLKYGKKVVMYTGGLERIYGLDMLIEGFLKANVSNSELHFYGNGSFSKNIIEWANHNNCIKYFGTKENSIIVKEQMKATLLVNPRYTNGEYTKYSFPGKNMEYMVSGTPVLTTCLPGMPVEYIPYVYILKEESIEAMASMLTTLLTKPLSELSEFGNRAKEWIISKKSSKMQVLKIISFVENNL